MDKKLTAEVLKTCESIGFVNEEEKYIAEPDWELCVKDLLLYLRRDDDDFSIRRLLGQTQVVGRDLLPLVKNYSKDPKTWEVTLRLLTNLTHPALLLYEEEIPKNKKYLSFYHEIEGHLRSYKTAFVDEAVWKTLAEKLRQLLDLDWEKRREQDKLTIERIFILIRNVLHVPADTAEERRADDDTSLHDRVLLVMHLSGIFDILLASASSGSSEEYSIILLEIMSCMFREQTGEQLAKTQWTRNEEDKIRDERELVRIMEREAVLKSIQLQKFSTRHSRFGGTFVLKDVKGPSGKDMLCHKPITSLGDLDLDTMKKRKKVASNRKPIVEGETTRRSTIPIRIILKNFCASFMDGKYNHLMTVVKDYINRSRGEDNDETYYLWGLKFFMEFNRHHDFQMKNVSETMSSNTFHYVQTLLDRYQGMMVTDKEKIPYWSRRAHMALKAYQELLFTLLWMDKVEDDDRVWEKSKSIKSNVFYLPEYRELCLGLLNTYDPLKLSKSYLKDLIETNHLFLKMLEDYSKLNRRIVIKCKGRKKKSKKDSKKKPPKIIKAKPMSTELLEEKWSEISESISSALTASSEVPDGEEGLNTNENVIPFDAASDIPIDEQKDTAVERIAVFLHTEKYMEAAILLRASREVWPTDADYFGDVDCAVVDELELLKTIFMDKASLAKVLNARTALLNPTSHQGEGEDAGKEVETSSVAPPVDEDEQERAAVIGDGSDEEREDDEEDEEEEEEDQRANEREQEFDFKGFVLKYAMARVVCNYALLFQDWDTLKPLTLHCILKMFHRFVFDMDYPALICQASLFLTFKKILQVADKRSDLKEAKGFFSHFWPKFVKLCENKKMFVEILFWKTAREAQEIQDGYADLRDGGSGKSKKKSDWTKDEDTELNLLVELYQDSPEEVKKAQKLIDFVMERWTWRARSKRAFLNRLLEKELIDPAEIASKAKRPPKFWSDDEISKLRELFEEHRESDDIMRSILAGMEIQRSKKAVIQKMIEIELIRDKSEVKKRRKRSNKKSSSQVQGDSDSDNERERENRESVIERGARSENDSSSSSSDSESNASSDEDDADNNAVSQSRGDSGSYDDEKVSDLGKKLMAKDMSVAIRWVKLSLKYYLEDLIDDPDSDESVPLVPIDSDCILAVSDSDFKMFLKCLGVNPPGEQEAYWRIPSYFKKKDVELRVDSLDKVLSTSDGSGGSAKQSNTNDTSKVAIEDDSDDDLPDIGQNLSDSDSPLNDQDLLPTKNQVSKRNRIIRDESSDSECEPEVSQSGKDDKESTIGSRKSKRAILDDSDSEDDGKSSSVEASNKGIILPTEEDAASNISDSSLVVRKANKRKRIVLDDSDDDDTGPNNSEQRNKKFSRTSAVIDSDSENSRGIDD